jgi:hypothetical protein
VLFIHSYDPHTRKSKHFSASSPTRRETPRSMLTFQITTYFVHILKPLRVTNTKSFNKSNKSNLMWTSKVLSQNISPLGLRLVSNNTFTSERLFQLRETGYDAIHHMGYAG